MDTWLLRMCRRACVRQLLAWAAVALTGVLLIGANVRYFSNFIYGPFVLGAAELDHLTNPAQTPHYFVRVAGANVMSTGIQEVAVKRSSTGAEVGRTVSGVFYAVDLGGKLLAVKTSSTPSAVVEGTLVPMSSDLPGALFRWGIAHKNLPPFYYGFYVDAGSNFRIAGYATAFLWVAFLALAVWKTLPVWRWLRDPSKHPLAKRTSSWGNAVSVSADVEREMGDPSRVKRETWCLTRNYLVKSSLLSFDVLRWRDVLWAYKQRVQRRVNFIPVAKTYAAVLVCYGGTATIPASEKHVDDMLQLTATRAPWALLGYSKELIEALKKNPSEFSARVEERRRAWQQRLMKS